MKRKLIISLFLLILLFFIYSICKTSAVFAELTSDEGLNPDNIIVYSSPKISRSINEIEVTFTIKATNGLLEKNIHFYLNNTKNELKNLNHNVTEVKEGMNTKYIYKIPLSTLSNSKNKIIVQAIDMAGASINREYLFTKNSSNKYSANGAPTVTNIKLTNNTLQFTVNDGSEKIKSLKVLDANNAKKTILEKNNFTTQSILTVNLNNFKTQKSKYCMQMVTVDLSSLEAVSTIKIEIMPTKITLNKNTINMNTLSDFTLIETIEPAKATNKKITWASSNTNVATVNDGVITSKSAGVATITAKTANNKIFATCTVNVTAPEAPILTMNTEWSSFMVNTSKNKTSEKVILNADKVVYSNAKTSNKAYGTNMQFFDIDKNGNPYYSSIDKEYNVYINKIVNSKCETMILNKFGHGQGFAVDSNGCVYIGSIATKKVEKNDGKCTLSAGISYFKFEDGKNFNTSAGLTYILPKEQITNYENIPLSNLNTSLQPILDEAHNQFAILNSSMVYIYKLSDIKSLTSQDATIKDLPKALYSQNSISLKIVDLSKINPIAKVNLKSVKVQDAKLNLMKDVQSVQGIALYNKQLYIYKCDYQKVSNALRSGMIAVYDYNKKEIVSSTLENLNQLTSTNSNELQKSEFCKYLNSGKFNTICEGQGIQVKNGKIYVGIYSDVHSGANKINKTCTIAVAGI